MVATSAGLRWWQFFVGGDNQAAFGCFRMRCHSFLVFLVQFEQGGGSGFAASNDDDDLTISFFPEKTTTKQLQHLTGRAAACCCFFSG